MRKHTPEPWPHFDDICEPSSPNPESSPLVRMCYEDYERASICVNACEGIEDPAKFIAGIRSELSLVTHKLLTCGVAARHPDASLSMRGADYGGKWNSPQAESVRKIRQQRDELLAALEAAIECGMVPTSSAKEGGAMHYVRQAHVADQIRAAIAKAKGV